MADDIIMSMENNQRMPTILLDYSQRHLAVKKELLFDYERGRMYVVSAEDKSVIFDITQQILNLISTDLPADSLIVNIDGFGAVNLKQYILQMKADMLTANTVKGKSAVGSYAYDYASIINKDGIIQVNDFDIAEEEWVPVKRSGVLRWVPRDAVSIIHDVQPDNDFIVDLSNYYNRTLLAQGAVVKLTANTNDVNRSTTIIWHVRTENVIPQIRFHSDTNVILEYSSDMEMKDNSIHVYKFVSWDAGNTWLETVKKYSTKHLADKVDTAYLNRDYYTKSEVNDLIEWKNNNKQTSPD